MRLVPHAGDWRAADVVRRAAELNQPPFALLETYHAGPLPQRKSYGHDDGAVVVTVVKRAEDGDGVVVRAYETAGRPRAARPSRCSADDRAEFGPNEIKTFTCRAT